MADTMGTTTAPNLMSLWTTVKAKRQTSATLAFILAIPLVLTKSVNFLPQGFEDEDDNLGRLLRFACEVCSEADIQKLAEDLSQATTTAVVGWAMEAAQAVVELEREHDSYKSRKDGFYSLYCQEKQRTKELEADKEERMSTALKVALDRNSSEWLGRLRRMERELSAVTEQLSTSKKLLEQGSEEWQREKASLLNQVELLSHDNKQLKREGEVTRARSAEMRTSREELSRALGRSRQEAAELTGSLAECRGRVEQHLQEITRLQNLLSANRTENVTTIMKENKNLRSAVRFLEKAKMDKDNEMVAVRFQLTEYQRKYGAFGPTHYFDSTHSTETKDGVQRAGLPKQDRKCPFCHTDFSKEDVSFIAHVKTCSQAQ